MGLDFTKAAPQPSPAAAPTTDAMPTVAAAPVQQETELSVVEKYDIVKAAIAAKAIPYCNIVCITGEEMKTMTEGYFQVLYDLNPQAVGGALPAEDFYLMAE